MKQSRTSERDRQLRIEEWARRHGVRIVSLVPLKRNVPEMVTERNADKRTS